MSRQLREANKAYKVITNNDVKAIVPTTSKPIHLQRVEKAVDLTQFLGQYNDNSFNLDDTSSSSDDEDHNEGKLESETISPKDYFNFSSVSHERSWLADILQENTDGAREDVQYQTILKLHAYQNSVRNDPAVNVKNYMYYGAGLLSVIDKYSEIERPIPVPVAKKKHNQENRRKSPIAATADNDDYPDDLEINVDYPNADEDEEYNMPALSNSQLKRMAKKAFKDEEAKKKWEDMMTIKRKKAFMNTVKKEIGKQHRAKTNKHKEMLLQCKRTAQQCAKVVRQKALQSTRIMKEQQWRMKRLARENIAYWKRSRRIDREVKKRLEKEAEEQRKIDHEIVEAKRQQRKLNFLITQTELYAHFMSKKLGTASPEEQLRILSQLDEEKNPRLMSIDDYDVDIMKETAKRNAQEAFQSERFRTKHFDMEANSSLIGPPTHPDEEQPQPLIFRGMLKGYQLRGMNWLANLYSQGISGILADEMGLGKTVQSIAFLCHIAEKYNVWGPFLIISPASTLHNWQQEIAKFVPSFKVVPYWGSPNERKILRQFWEQKDIYTKDASFHIVVTSYQIVISDIKYFNRIKWQYMILDEAQAIKSTSSMRWKTLLGFSCRNRLLLSGTPIQNSMAELWALLHFIMPTLFDSHEEFNEWFSKDIESHAENKTGIDEKHLSRLHMILKPFMLRRIKKDVENELSDKIEIMVYCPLTTRQKLLYIALKQKIKIEDLLHYSVGGGDSHTVDKNFTSNLMNLVMQFRKVCNHPELFERRDAKSPVTFTNISYNVPYLVYDFNTRAELSRKIRKFNFSAEHIHYSRKSNPQGTLFNFLTALNLSPEELFLILQENVLHRWQYYFNQRRKVQQDSFLNIWHGETPFLNIAGALKLNEYSVDTSDVLSSLLFTRKTTASNVIYTHTDPEFYFMSETVEHKNIRLKLNPGIEEICVVDEIKTEEEKYRPPFTRPCQATALPRFLFCGMPKTIINHLNLYSYSRRAAWDYQRHLKDYSYKSLDYYWRNSTLDNFTNGLSYMETTRYPLENLKPVNGWSHIFVPDKESLVTDAGKLFVLDNLLRKLKEEGHRVLIYSQMTKMIDLLEEFMWHRHHKYMRLDGSSKISERRDMVADFQARNDIFVFLLSTRAGGLGINLTAADTVIFYDSDWNPTVDQQAMDRAHRLGQTKQVTVYRLICKGTIEERILQRAREKSEIQKLVISGGNCKPDTLKPKEVVTLLLDDEELLQKVKPSRDDVRADKKRKQAALKTNTAAPTESKKIKLDSNQECEDLVVDSAPNSPLSTNSPDVLTDDLSDASFMDDSDPTSSKYTVYNVYGSTVKPRSSGRGSSKRGRPRGSRRVSNVSRAPSTSSNFDINIMDVGPCSSLSMMDSGVSTSHTAGPVIRRGPGRPRLKPTGPSNSGSRGSYKPRKPARPLPVPLPSDGNAGGGVSDDPTYSNMYDFQEQIDL